MTGREIESGAALFIPRLDEDQQQRIDRAAAANVARRVVAEHPGSPANDPTVRDEVCLLLDALGLKPEQIRRTP